MTDAFGLVALVALSPLLTIQIFGAIYALKSKRTIDINVLDESIVEYDIIPMLREYWFDNDGKFNQQSQNLRKALND